MSDVPHFEIVAAVVAAHAEHVRNVWAGGRRVHVAELEVVLANERRLARLDVPNFEAFIDGHGNEAAGALGAQSEAGASCAVGIQLPDGFFVVACVDVVDVTRLGAGQEAVRVEVIPHDALDLAFHAPAFEALAAAIVDACLRVATSRQKCLDFERVKLQALHFFRVRESRRHRLLAHVPQHDSVIR